MQRERIDELTLCPEGRGSRRPTAEQTLWLFSLVERYTVLAGDRVLQVVQPELPPTTTAGPALARDPSTRLSASRGSSIIRRNRLPDVRNVGSAVKRRECSSGGRSRPRNRRDALVATEAW